MKILGLAWLGSSSGELDAMTELLGDRMGLEVEREQAGARVFRFPDGGAFEIFKPSDSEHDFFDHPVAGILVDDVREVRAHLEAAGIEFVGDVHDGVADSWATAWSHFRAPDGYLYVLVSRPELEPEPHPAPFDELRVCLKVSDLDSAVRLYRDGLGMRIVDEWTHPGGQRGVLFGAVYAAVELFDEAQWDLVDESETGSTIGRDHGLRVEVSDAARLRALADQLEAVGAKAIGEVTRTPWHQTCLRMTDGEGEQLTLFVLPDEEKKVRADTRARLRP